MLPRLSERWEVRQGDALELLRQLPAGVVRCCVTSPPYFGLRDYGTAKWEGGEAGCDHDQRRRERDPESKSASNAGAARDGVAGSAVCRKCGALRVDSQLGLEATPAEYVAKLVEVFSEVRRVLTDDGTLWLNLGSSYANVGNANPTMHHSTLGKKPGEKGCHLPQPVKEIPDWFKPKDLVPIPWMVAMALQADGWWLRSDIIWAKPNPMPESVRDRPTKAHEYVFLMSKSERYYFDQDAVREPHTCLEHELKYHTSEYHERRGGDGYHSKIRNLTGGQNGLQRRSDVDNGGRNVRSVWTIATNPFPEAHFATFPPALPERCIKAGSAPGDLVLDPFSGAGTTGLVALRLGRRFLGWELNPEYAEMARRRITNDAPLLNTPAEPVAANEPQQQEIA